MGRPILRGGVSIGILTNFTLTAQLFSGHCPADQPPEPPRITPEQAAIQSAESRNRELTKEIAKKDAKIQALEDEIKALKKPKKPTATKTSAWRAYEVTAYTNGFSSTGKSKGDPGYGITASGKKTAEGRTIACPPSIPFGTRVQIEGVGVRVCEDRGSAIKEGHLDVYVRSEKEALSFGRRSLRAKIINN
ncbi:3D domain-containing protein [Bacillus licheniformis]|uniref:3D domain-containing protein n=1 Tax=Bacillus licheniformis TaxID=1402 RepID=UPI0011AAA35D|nr:3D domain-containing protein [Bacillus licheniformis]